MDGAGTNANVFLTIFGENGDSGERKLAKSDTHYDKFERNQVCNKIYLIKIFLKLVLQPNTTHRHSSLYG